MCMQNLCCEPHFRYVPKPKRVYVYTSNPGLCTAGCAYSRAVSYPRMGYTNQLPWDRVHKTVADGGKHCTRSSGLWVYAGGVFRLDIS